MIKTTLDVLGGNAPPDRFRLFKAGWNETEKGAFLFDDDAANSVLAAYEAWGVDLMIDLEHLSLDDRPSPDPTSKDARGWAQLELAEDGSLWAVGVKWTSDGAQRLTEKRQRYVSPAFDIDPKSKRITKIINVAITALPATHNTPALIAASLNGSGMLNLEQVKAALDALIAGDAEKCSELLKGMIAEAAAAPAADEAAEGEVPTAPETPPVAESAAPPPAAAAPDAPAQEEDKKDDEEAATVAASRLMKLTAAPTLVVALATIAEWRKSHIELETERQKLAAEQAKLESSERKRLCIELIKLGAEFPATVWTDEKCSDLQDEWKQMSLESLRSRVTKQASARGAKPKTLSAPVSEPAEQGSKTFKTKFGAVTLTASELQTCADVGAKPEVFAENKAIRSKQAQGAR